MKNEYFRTYYASWTLMEENGKYLQKKGRDIHGEIVPISEKGMVERNRQSEKLICILDTLQAERWTWNRNLIENIPLDVNLDEDDRTAVFHPRYSIGTAAIFGEKPLRATTVAYWEVHVPALYGTSIMFGVGRKSARTYSICHFEALLGGEKSDDESFGLSHLGVLHGGRFKGRPGVGRRQFCERFENHPVNIGLLFHGPEGWLAYFVEGRPLGIAFTDIDASLDEFYPMISSTSQRSVFTLTKQLSVEFCRLLSGICMEQIITHMLKNFKNEAQLKLAVDSLNLPLGMDTSIVSNVLRLSEDATQLRRQGKSGNQLPAKRRKRDSECETPSKSEALHWENSFKRTKVL